MILIFLLSKVYNNSHQKVTFYPQISLHYQMSNFQNQMILSRDCFNPPYNGYNLTNRVLVQKTNTSTDSKSKKNVNYYCPVYMRIKLKNFSEMSLNDLSATINMVILLTVKLNNIPPLIEQQIKKKMVLRFNRDSPIALGDGSQEITHKTQQDGLFTFIIRKMLHAGMKADIFYSPFEMINLILTINVQKVTITREQIRTIIKEARKEITKLEEEKEQAENNLEEISDLKKQIQYLSSIQSIAVYFNCMDYQKNQYVKISYSEQGTFGNYDLAEQLLKAQFTNQELSPIIIQELKQKQESKGEDYSKLKAYQYSHFKIPLYKFPFVTLFTIFIPLWLLGIINLGIFFQDTGLGDRIGSLSALMIAFVALLPVIRQALPPNPNITLVEILVYLETFTTIFCFIQSIIQRKNSEYDFNGLQNGLFLVSMIINILEVIIISSFMVIHKCVWQRSYNRHVEDIGDLKFDFKDWANIQCDNHFIRKLDNGKVKILKEYGQEIEKDGNFKQQKSLLLVGQKEKKQSKTDKKVEGQPKKQGK